MAKKKSIDLNQLYQSFLTQFSGDAVTAGQYTAFQRLANPTGSMTGLDVAQPWFTKKQWYDRDAPNYNAVINFEGDTATLDKFTKATVDAFEPFKNKDITLTDISKIANQVFKAGGATETSYTVQDVYNQYKDFLTEKTRAENSYKTQLGTHQFTKYGLNPELRYGVVADKANNIVAYKPAADYFAKKGKAYYANLISRKFSVEDATKAANAYSVKLAKLIETKIAASGISPFLEQVASKTRARK